MASKKPVLNLTKMNITRLCDELGVAKANSTDANDRYEALKAEFKSRGVPAASGRLFDVSIASFDRSYTDFESLLQAHFRLLKASGKGPAKIETLQAKYTRLGATERLTVSARSPETKASAA